MALALIFLCVFLSAVALSLALLPDEASRLLRKRIYSEVRDSKEPSVLDRLSERFTPLNRRLVSGWYIDRLTKKLAAAGLRVPSYQTLFLQEAGAFLGAMIYFAMNASEPFSLGKLLFFVAMGFMIPAIRLDGKIRARRLTFTRDLPELVDLLTLCVLAGNDFMSALNRIVREFRPCPLRDELAVVLQEIRLGKRRSDALRAFAKRVQTVEASSFARTLIQVDRMGTGLTEAMSVLSEDIRLQRYHWSERYAQQAPMKMMLPLICCLAAAMAMVSGPILIQFFRGGLMTPQISADHEK